MNLTTFLLLTTLMILSSCKGGEEAKDAMASRNIVEKVKEQWQNTDKPLEIAIEGRSKSELEAIGTIGVVCKEGQEAVEFHFDGDRFKPLTPILADSTVVPSVFFPFISGTKMNDTIAVSFPISQRLNGINPSISQADDKIIAKMELKEITSMLRLRLQSDNIADILDCITIEGSCIVTKGKIMSLKGKWIDTGQKSGIAEMHCDELLNNGRCNDFNLVPNEQSGDVRITIKANGKPYVVSTTLPPLRAGSITELRLNLVGGNLTVGSSWVDTKHEFIQLSKVTTDSIKSGFFLLSDGTPAANYKQEAIAMVVETDGKHGKAVSLKDVDFEGFDNFKTGKAFETADGTHSEGCFYKPLLNEGTDNHIQFSPSITYNQKCAFSAENGIQLTRELLHNASEKDKKTFNEIKLFHTAYIPSLSELAMLSKHLRQRNDPLPEEFVMPNDFLMTCCESSATTFYSLNPVTCQITGYNSKKYPTTKLRLFYLF